MVKITLPVVKQYGVNSSKENWTFDVSQIAIGDWMEKGSSNIVPNKSKIVWDGSHYCIDMSRCDLEKHLEEAGVKILKPLNK